MAARGRPVTEPCGTSAGRRRHIRWGEEVCDWCRAAYAGEQAQMYEQRKRCQEETS